MSSISRPTLNFIAKRITYKGEMATNNALVKQKEPLQMRATIQNNARVNRSLSPRLFPWKP